MTRAIVARHSINPIPRITTSLATLRVAAALLALADEYRVVLVICCGCSQPLIGPGLTLTGHRPEWGSAPQHLDFRTIQACPKDAAPILH